MKSQRLIFSEYGQPTKVLKLETFETPSLKQGEVLLEIQAAPINPADLNYIEGTYGIKPQLPSGAGIECFAKVIESQSEKFSPGDPVIPISRIGGWADHAITDESNLIRLPQGIDPLQAAMLKVNPATAMLLLTRFETLSAGDSVVLNAANSSVGQCTVRLASEFGIRTVCFLRNIHYAEKLKALGATHVYEDSPAGLSEAKDMLGGNPAKLAFNAVGGESALRLLKLLGTSGTHITYGAMARKPLTIPNGPLIFNDIRIRGLWVTKWIENGEPQEVEATYVKLANMILAGSLHQEVDSTYQLSDFQPALLRLEAPQRNGKILFQKRT